MQNITLDGVVLRHTILFMLIRLNPRRRESIYLQIVSQIKHLVVGGRLKIGEQLPTVRQLAAELNLNPNTVARAYNQLIEEGVIAAQQGRGTYIYQTPSSAENRKSRRERVIAEVDELLRDAEHLGCEADELEKIWRDRFAAWRKARVTR
ncbi:MAG: GntR family transcriptional regulator [Chloroflexi bacterium]|nr:GntR family transcriptional regulator [Chloroflexota bacterium]